MQNNDSQNLLSRLKQQFPSLEFRQDELFFWSPSEHTVHFAGLGTTTDKKQLIHEVGHALCGHRDYNRDIDLLKREREAWEKAKDLAGLFDITISTDFIEEALESYRDWLHQRSLCPTCSQVGIQETEHTYKCLLCSSQWRVNDARRCGLKRYKLTT